MKKSGLGRNLSALLQHNEILLKDNKYLLCDISKLQAGKYQPRREINEDSLAELTMSIKSQGLLQPLVVRPINNSSQYEIIAGERRWRACKLAGMQEIPVLVHVVDDATTMAMALVENLQREDLNVVEEAYAMLRLVEEFQLTHNQIAEILAKSRATISNSLRLLNLEPDVLSMLKQGLLDMGHARALLILQADKQILAAELIVKKQLSVRAAEALVAKLKGAETSDLNPSKFHQQLSGKFLSQLDSMADKLKTDVKIKETSKGTGWINIAYKDAVHLEQLLCDLL
jgi:ParB family transcriptional regulator, chromosome partitioning protein